ncbi:GNAT family N-acetyltransferase [Streptomyces boncukensis]|uniref:GNAT family N-acetyltransferase n=1 Tax=Streptomyces boncukensis TaxID=2711219 RepID=A0A6G4WYK6_9ACTN|nr:GNAT family N-acetyltransferase [Streptomyces boncukensis]NGO69942.1 GNAT family N-acetyltransferase [Streptomyces boncukensis]
MAVECVRHSQRPELWDRLDELFAGVVPEYNLHGDIGDAYWARLFAEFPDYQFVLYDTERDDILGTGRSLPRTWDGTPQGLGAGLDDSIAAAFAARDSGARPDVLCALGIEVAPAHQRRGYSALLLAQLVELARHHGLTHVIVPVRPTWKDRYPLVPIDRYARWTRGDGAPFDPWIRAQVRAGGTVAAATAHSSRITGTVAEWESWTGMRFPEDGEYVFPGGLAQLTVDRSRDRGVYWEPSVWVTHSVTPTVPRTVTRDARPDPRPAPRRT